MSSRRAKHRGTFVIKILGRENATWQGSVTWAEQNKVQNFRSALELLKMMDAALDGNSEEEGGDHEA